MLPLIFTGSWSCMCTYIYDFLGISCKMTKCTYDYITLTGEISIYIIQKVTTNIHQFQFRLWVTCLECDDLSYIIHQLERALFMLLRRNNARTLCPSIIKMSKMHKGFINSFQNKQRNTDTWHQYFSAIIFTVMQLIGGSFYMTLT